MSLLFFDDVCLEYRSGNESVMALDHITLSVEQGEFITIVGPSGCGKSSLLALAAGIYLPQSGKVWFDHKQIVDVDPKRGIMFQQSLLYPWLTVRQNLEFGLRMKGVAKEERTRLVDPYLQQMDLHAFANHRPYQLSGGMKQRAALARTLVNDPQLVLMDEPFSSLDAITKKTMHGLILRIWRDTGKTFLFVTHDVDEAVKLGTRIFIMSPRPGRILQEINKQSNDRVDMARLVDHICMMLENK